jgi:hypothetical protein
MATPFPRLTPAQFFVPEKMLRIFLYRAQKTVVYSRHVKRKKPNILEDYFAKIIRRSTPSLAWGFYSFWIHNYYGYIMRRWRRINLLHRLTAE